MPVSATTADAATMVTDIEARSQARGGRPDNPLYPPGMCFEPEHP
jgi:hypothetical protein